MEKKTLILLTVAALFISVISFAATVFLKYTEGKIIDQKIYYARIIVGNFYGVDVNYTALIFGAVQPGGSSLRAVEVNNTYDFPLHVDILPRGEISRFVSRQEVTLEEGELRVIEIKAIVPEGMQHGTYEGEVLVRITRKD